MDIRIRVPDDLLRDPEIARRVRDFRREERLRHAVVGGGMLVALLACLTRGPALWAAGALYLAAALWWTVRLERLLAHGLYDSFHTLERAVWARLGRLRVREEDVLVLRAYVEGRGLSERVTLAEIYEHARERRGADALAEDEFRGVADAVYRFLVVHRHDVTDAMLRDLLPRAALFVAALALLGGAAAALLAAGTGTAAERAARLTVGGYLLALARGVDVGQVAALWQGLAVAAAAALWVLHAGSAGLLALPLAFACMLWYGRRAPERE